MAPPDTRKQRMKYAVLHGNSHQFGTYNTHYQHRSEPIQPGNTTQTHPPGTIPIEGPDATRVLGEPTAAENAVPAFNLRSLLAHA